MTINTEGEVFQAFRCRSTGEEIEIPVQEGSTQEESFVLWSDIQTGFANAKSIKRGNTLVPFVKDKCHPILPLRIKCQPGVVLEVDSGTDAKSIVASSETDIESFKPTCRGAKSFDQDSDHYSTKASVNTRSMTDDTVVIPGLDTINRGLAKYSERSLRTSWPHLYDGSSPPGTFLPTITLRGDALIDDIKRCLERGFNQAQINDERILRALLQTQDELAEVKKKLYDAKDELAEVKERLDDAKDELLKKQDELVKKQDEMQDLQKRTLEGLAVTLHHGQALLIQNYELHEYPIPRLFVVLPKTSGVRDKITTLFSEQFRLYFLCECGDHTKPKDCKTKHEVHLAKHGGYDLERPKEFFEKYGSYVMAMMCMVKYGIIAGGIAVPPLATSKLVEGLDSIQRHMDHLKRNFVPLVNDMMNYLQYFKTNGGLGNVLASTNTELGRLEALEGADLRQLESFLKAKDQGRALGNLYRIVTPEGHVKWVCFDHYRANYRESVTKELQEAIRLHQGTFTDDSGCIKIEIGTSLQARQFYEAMVKARGIHELEIKLKWEVTTDDLRDLCSAVTKANVLRLTITGTHFKRPAADFVNRGRLFDPILKLASNARIQSLQLIGFEDFFSRVSKSTYAPTLRIFSMDWKAPLDDKAIKLFNGFLECCSGLTTLDLRVRQQYPTTKALMDTFPKIRKLTSLKVDYGEFSLTTSFIKGVIKDATITVTDLNDIKPADLRFIRQVSFTRLVIESEPSRGADSHLTEILRHNQSLSHLQVRGKTLSDTSPRFKMELCDMITLLALTTNNKLESLSIDYGRLKLAAIFSQGANQDTTMKFERLDCLTSDDLKFIQQGPYRQLRIEHDRKEDGELLADILGQSSVLNYLRINCHGERYLTIAMAAEMDLQDLVNLATSENSSTLEHFSLDCRRLTLEAGFSQGMIQNMTMTIKRTQDLTADDLMFILQGHITHLVIESAPLLKDEDTLKDVLSHNPMLSQLQIQHQDLSSSSIALELPLWKLMTLPTLDTLKHLQSFSVEYERFALTATFLQGKTRNASLSFDRIGDLTSDDIKFIRNGPYSRLRILNIREDDEEPLTDILQQNPALSYLRINCYEKDLLVIATFGMKLQDIVNLAKSESSGTLESYSVYSRRLTLSATFSRGEMQDMTMTIENLDDLLNEDLTFIYQGHLTQLIINSAPRCTDEPQLVTILRYNPMLTEIQLLRQYHFARATSPELPLQNLVKLVKSENLAMLQAFSVYYGRFALTTTIPQVGTQNTTLSIMQLSDLTSDDVTFIQQGPYEQLEIEHIRNEDVERLFDVLRQSPGLSYVQVRHYGYDRPIVLSAFGITLQDLVMLAASDNLAMLQSFELECRRLALAADFSRGSAPEMTMTIGRLDDLTSDDIGFISQGHLTKLTIESAPLTKDKDRLNGILRHNPMLAEIQIVRQYRHDLPMGPELPLQELVKLVTMSTLCKLQSFSVHYGRFALRITVSPDKARNMTFSIMRLSSLTSDDIAFILHGPYSQLRVEHIRKDDEVPLFDILRQSSGLSFIRVKRHESEYLVILSESDMNIQDLVNMITSGDASTLKSFSVYCQRLMLSATALQGRERDMTMTIERFSDLNSDDLKFIKQGLYRQLKIGYKRKEDEGPLADILRQNLALNYRQYRCHGDRCLTIATPHRMNIQYLMNLAKLEAPTKLESFSIGCGRLTLRAETLQGKLTSKTQDMIMQFNRFDNLTSDDLKFVRHGPYRTLRIEYTRKEDGGPLLNVIRQTPALSSIQIRHHGERHLAIAVATDMVLQDLVNMVTSEAFDTLEFFSVDCRRFALSAGVSQGKAQDLTMTIDRFHDLTSDDLAFIRQGHLIQLIISSTSIPMDESLLEDIIRHNPMLNRLQFQNPGRLAGSTTSNLPLQKLVKLATLDTLASLRYFSANYGRLALTSSFLHGKAQETILSFNRFDDLMPDDLAFIQQGPYDQLRIDYTHKEDQKPLLGILRESSVSNYIHISRHGERHFAIAAAADLGLHDLMNLTTSENSSTFESFSIGCRRLTISAELSQGRLKDTAMAIKRIHYLTSDDLTFASQGHLTQLAIGSAPLSRDEYTLRDILCHNPMLSRLQIQHRDCSPRSIALELPLRKLMKLPSLDALRNIQSFSIEYGRFTLTATTSHGKTRDMTLTYDRFSDLTAGDLKFIRKGPYSQLRIVSTQKKDEELMTDVLRQNPALSYLCIRCHEKELLTIATFGMRLQDMVNLAASYISGTLESYSVNCRKLTLSSRFSSGRMQHMTMAIEKLDDLLYDDLKYIYQGHLTQLSIDSALRCMDENRFVSILRHNPLLTKIQLLRQYHFASNTTPELSLQKLMRLVASENLSKLQSFSVFYGRFALTTTVSPGNILNTTLSCMSLIDLTSDDIAFIQQGPYSQLRIEHIRKDDEEQLFAILRRSSELTYVQMRRHESDRPIIISAIGMKIQDLVNMVMSEDISTLESFSVNCRRLSLCTTFSQGSMQDMTMTIERLSDLNLDDLGFIQNIYLTRLMIKYTPQEVDESRFTEILRQCPALSYLQVGCEWKRSLAIANLVLSTRERNFEQGDSFGLRTVDLMDEDLIPFDELAHLDNNTHIQCHLSFPEGSDSFDMRTWIRLQNGMDEKDAGPVRDFIRHYGWSVVSFEGFLINDDVFTAILNHIPNQRSYQMESLTIHADDSGTTWGDNLDRVLQRSLNFKHLGLYIQAWDETLHSVIDLYGTVLSKLYVFAGGFGQWSELPLSFPTRNSFPNLVSFELFPRNEVLLPWTFSSWIIAMVSAPPRGRIAPATVAQSPLQQDGEHRQSSHHSEPTEPWTSLRKILLRQVRLRPGDWNAVVMAIDFSNLEYLDLRWSNIYLQAFELLVDRIIGYSASHLPLKTLDISGTHFAQMTHPTTLDALLEDLQKKAPWVTVIQDT
ncbi:hypothetical protein BGX34_004009 [Mortierella sp. NVP85]|nr:hypothetical protein BGX34_004009 [Mortierella sp. NVP85]